MAYTDHRRCTAVTINAIAKHHGVPGIGDGDKAPIHGTGVLNHFTKHGLKYKVHDINSDEVVGKSIKNFVDKYPTGAHYISTAGHAMAVVDGKLHDSAGKHLTKSKVTGAFQ